jgi:hypothetical protein
MARIAATFDIGCDKERCYECRYRDGLRCPIFNVILEEDFIQGKLRCQQCLQSEIHPDITPEQDEKNRAAVCAYCKEAIGRTCYTCMLNPDKLKTLPHCTECKYKIIPDIRCVLCTDHKINYEPKEKTNA